MNELQNKFTQSSQTVASKVTSLQTELHAVAIHLRDEIASIRGELKFTNEQCAIQLLFEDYENVFGLPDADRLRCININLRSAANSWWDINRPTTTTYTEYRGGWGRNTQTYRGRQYKEAIEDEVVGDGQGVRIATLINHGLAQLCQITSQIREKGTLEMVTFHRAGLLVRIQTEMLLAQLKRHPAEQGGMRMHHK
ncbi:hypothetical protein PR048_025358 [Dryococelus australis]|uniref:Uncharacterized protein n=1 Tax=Dryococelus australis TaxID=614101 RepID=A0ABQ9GR63_9NEOP|nr:hypothetical protein PR048_025358 [Dryococelus australis]